MMDEKTQRTIDALRERIAHDDAADWAACRSDDRLLSPSGEVLWTGPAWRGGES